MVSLPELQARLASATTGSSEYRCQANLNIYASPECHSLATQAAIGRYLRILSLNQDCISFPVELAEDNYPGWLLAKDIEFLAVADTPYQPVVLSEAEIQARLPEAIAFTYAAMAQPNYYLWGGTVAPNYDCSGLMQAAFASVGIWLPRDSYQQEAFLPSIPIQELQPGDLVFFGKNQRVTHVGLYLGEGRYIHSSGKDMGRNGIGINLLSPDEDEVSRNYYQQLWGAGRVVASYLFLPSNQL